MIVARMSPERVRAMLRKIVPQLSIQQRLKLMRELAEADARDARGGQPPPGRGGPGRAPSRETGGESGREAAPARESAPARDPARDAAPVRDAAPARETAPVREAAPVEEAAPVREVPPEVEPVSVVETAPVREEALMREAAPEVREPVREIFSSHVREEAPAPALEVVSPPVELPVRDSARAARDSLWRETGAPVAAPSIVPTLEDSEHDMAFSPEPVPAVESAPVASVPNAGRLDISPDWPAPGAVDATPAAHAVAGEAHPAPVAAVEVEESVTEHGSDLHPRATWERRLYRLFKPARTQAKALDATALTTLIRQAVTEVRAK